MMPTTKHVDSGKATELVVVVAYLDEPALALFFLFSFFA